MLGIRKGAGIRIFCQNCFLAQCGKTSWRNPLVFQKISGIKNFMDKRVISRFSVQIFLSHSTKKPYKGTLLCLRKTLVSKTFMHKRGKGNTIIRFFLCHSTETFRKGTLLRCVSENFRSRESYWMRGGGREERMEGRNIKTFRRNFFVQQYEKTS